MPEGGYVAGPIKMGGLWYMRHVAGPMAWVECGAWGVCGRANKNGWTLVPGAEAKAHAMGGVWCLGYVAGPMTWAECGAWRRGQGPCNGWSVVHGVCGRAKGMGGVWCLGGMWQGQ